MTTKPRLRREAEADASAEPIEAAVTPVETDRRTAARRDGERDGGRRRRRRGRGRGRGGEPREPRAARSLSRATPGPNTTIAHEDHDAGSPEEAMAPIQQQPRQGGAPGEAEGGDVRRRRRRGRRGGRRNRQGRERRSAVPIQWRRGPNPNLQHAVEDLDRPPASFDSAPAMKLRPSNGRSSTVPITSRRFTARSSRLLRHRLPHRPNRNRRAAARPSASRRRSALPAPPPSPVPISAADAGDLLDGERGQRPTQARLVGQAPVWATRASAGADI